MACPSEKGRPQIGHVLETSLYVRDLDKSSVFYESLFGFTVFFKDARMCALGVGGRQVLLLFSKALGGTPGKVPGGVIPAHAGEGALHLCFAIDRDDLPRWEAELAAMAVAVESRVTWPLGGISLYFRDPDGNSLELATPGLWPNY